MTNDNFYEQIQAAKNFIQSRITGIPTVGVILGSGLNGLVNALKVEHEIPYSAIPNFPVSTVEGHTGKMLFGTLAGKKVVMMAGRFHYYEGYSMKEVTLPVRVMKALGVEKLFVSNAAGAMNPAYQVGDIVVIRDHMNLFPEHPLRGVNDERLGPRFPDMSEPYSKEFIKKAVAILENQKLPPLTGIYAGLQGPTYETRAEYEWLSRMGADLVGMSTVPEVIVAIHSEMEVFAASVVTDIGIREEANTITHEEVLVAANAAAPKMEALFEALIAEA